MTKPVWVLVTAVFLVLGGPRRWWVGTRSLTKHGSRRRRLFGRCRAGVVSGRGVLVVGAVCRLRVWMVRFQQSGGPLTSRMFGCSHVRAFVDALQFMLGSIAYCPSGRFPTSSWRRIEPPGSSMGLCSGSGRRSTSSRCTRPCSRTWGS